MTSNKKIHFEISERKVLLRVFDVLVVGLALYFVGKGFGLFYLTSSTTTFYYMLVLGLYLTSIGTVFEMYNLQVASNQYQVLKSILLTASTTVLLYLLTPVFSAVLPSNRLQIVVFFLTVFLALLFWRLFYVVFLASNRFVQKGVLICDTVQIKELIQGLEQHDPHYKIIGYVNVDQHGLNFDDYNAVKNIKGSDLISFVKEKGISEIVIADQNMNVITTELYQQLLLLLESGTTIREYTKVYEDRTHRIPVQYISRDFYRFFPFSRSNNNQIYLFGTQLINLMVAFIGLMASVVLIPFVLLGNAFANRGDLFYAQERVGKNGNVFRIYKFRTMIHNAETQGAVFSTVNDHRVTVFGKFLRKTRIDEFPQFFNILKGDMGLIGPRPERPVFVREIAERMPFYETRHVIKPGLTGWAQVNYSYGESFDDSLIKLQYDLFYIKHRSIFLDLNIALKTLTTVLFYRGQ
jgi:exopolysaccharide biosynthesis polyprenyl glycosylphosphotransferase